MRRTPWIATVLALLAGALLAAPPSQAAPGMEVALQDDAVLVARYYYDRELALQHARRLQVTWLRTNISWSVAAGKYVNRRRTPKRLRYDFSRWDAMIDHAAARHINVQVTLTGPAPRFAAGNRRIGPYKPSVRLFRRFVAAAAQHFRGRVRRYAIWNEPNHVGWLSPLRRSGALYRRLYAAGYGKIKRIDPGAQVLIGETSPRGRRGVSLSPLRFLRAATCARRHYRPARRCTPLHADGYAHHGYDLENSPSSRYPGRNNVTLGTLGRLTSALDKLARSRRLSTPAGAPLDVYITEYGYIQTGRFGVPEDRRSRYLAQAFEIAQRHPRVRQLLQYLLVRPPKPWNFFDTAILTRRGKPQRSYRALAWWTGTAAQQGRIAIPFVPPPPPPAEGGEPPPEEGGPTSPSPEPPPPPSDQPPPPPPPPESGPCPPVPPDLPCPPEF
jgi:hypothetical protein